MMWSYGTGWGGWIAMTVGMLAFWTAVVMAVSVLIRRGRDDRSSWCDGAGQPDPLMVLDVRFARGEIGLEDYQICRALLIKSH